MLEHTDLDILVRRTIIEVPLQVLVCPVAPVP